MARKLARTGQGKGVKTAPLEEGSSGPEEGWPARRLKSWPIDVGFSGPAEGERLKRIRMMGYQKVVGSVQVLFTDDNMVPVLGRLQDYCFQQGAMTNANPRDRAFFMSCLAHDLVFFEGDQGRAIVEDMPLDAKVYTALPHMRSSFLDLLRLERRSVMGRVEAVSLLGGERRVMYQAGPLGGPRAGEVVLGRVVSFGRSHQMVDPRLKVREEHADEVVKVFEEEYEACRSRHAGLTTESMLKVAGYHLYEEVAARRLRDELGEALPRGMSLRPRMVSFRVSKRRDLPDLNALSEVVSKARVMESDDAGRASLVMVDLAPASGIHRSVREAMVTLEGQEVMVVAFVAQGMTGVLEALTDALPGDVQRRDEELSPLALYRALRHTVKGR